MLGRAAVGPAFGEADLSNCEREQIHLAGSIQPHGALLVAREPDYVLVQASLSAAEFLGLEGPLLGRPIEEIEGDLWQRIRPHLRDPLRAIPLAVRCRVGRAATEFDCLLHRPEGGGLVIELERAGPAVDLSRHVERALQTVLGCSSLRMLCDETARLFRELTGYDRVMVYRFDEEGHGEVFSERKKSHLESYLGNWYPASDIPQMARKLYERNRVRVLVDVAYAPVPLTPQLLPMTGRDLDMSLCFLRSMSPIHIQYLKNMGVCATLVVSIMVSGKLWGLVACHHYARRFVHFEIRAVCELLAEAVATRIAALEGFAQAQVELSVRRLEQRMAEAIARDGDWRIALFDKSQSLLLPIGATGAALMLDGEILTAGDVPGTQELRAIGAWLEGRADAQVVSTGSLAKDAPEFAHLSAVACGLLAVRISTSPGEFLVWFRPERIKTVTWGGNPFKPVMIGNSPSDLSPRRSFSQWHELVEGTAEAWTPADLTTGRLIGETVTDIVLQFRTVRMLIAQDQLEKVKRQVQVADQPVVVGDAQGRILLVNQAFFDLIGTRSQPSHIEELGHLFADARGTRQSLHDLLRHRRPWRGEAEFLAGTDERRALLVRADPVYSAPGLVLGFVLLFIDISERKSVEAARRRLEEDIIEPNAFGTARLGAKADAIYRNLLSAVVENAQLAALEITDGIAMARMPEMLESIRASVSRSAEVLEHLVWHATRAINNDDP
jgi:light-regulated signal transduction histidine kinase (bacteriophytochrome)